MNEAEPVLGTEAEAGFTAAEIAEAEAVLSEPVFDPEKLLETEEGRKELRADIERWYRLPVFQLMAERYEGNERKFRKKSPIGDLFFKKLRNFREILDRAAEGKVTEVEKSTLKEVIGEIHVCVDILLPETDGHTADTAIETESVATDAPVRPLSAKNIARLEDGETPVNSDAASVEGYDPDALVRSAKDGKKAALKFAAHRLRLTEERLAAINDPVLTGLYALDQTQLYVGPGGRSRKEVGGRIQRALQSFGFSEHTAQSVFQEHVSSALGELYTRKHNQRESVPPPSGREHDSLIADAEIAVMNRVKFVVDQVMKGEIKVDKSSAAPSEPVSTVEAATAAAPAAEPVAAAAGVEAPPSALTPEQERALVDRVVAESDDDVLKALYAGEVSALYGDGPDAKKMNTTQEILVKAFESLPEVDRRRANELLYDYGIKDTDRNALIRQKLVLLHQVKGSVAELSRTDADRNHPDWEALRQRHTTAETNLLDAIKTVITAGVLEKTRTASAHRSERAGSTERAGQLKTEFATAQAKAALVLENIEQYEANVGPLRDAVQALERFYMDKGFAFPDTMDDLGVLDVMDGRSLPAGFDYPAERSLILPIIAAAEALLTTASDGEAEAISTNERPNAALMTTVKTNVARLFRGSFDDYDNTLKSAYRSIAANLVQFYDENELEYPEGADDAVIIQAAEAWEPPDAFDTGRESDLLSGVNESALAILTATAGGVEGGAGATTTPEAIEVQLASLGSKYEAVVRNPELITNMNSLNQLAASLRVFYKKAGIPVSLTESPVELWKRRLETTSMPANFDTVKEAELVQAVASEIDRLLS